MLDSLVGSAKGSVGVNQIAAVDVLQKVLANIPFQKCPRPTSQNALLHLGLKLLGLPGGEARAAGGQRRSGPDCSCGGAAEGAGQYPPHSPNFQKHQSQTDTQIWACLCARWRS